MYILYSDLGILLIQWGINMTTSQEVDEAQKVYEELLNKYLTERGWVEDPKWNTWDKHGTGRLYTNEGAYWREVNNES